MGVHGLWRLIEPSGKPVPLESLENKILAVDISIWLHQAVKGFQDSRGAPLPNAHLLGIYHRVCKLLYFRVKPVFIFDGGVPVLKKQTIAKRNQVKTKNLNEANDIQTKLIKTLLKQSAVSKVISEKAAASLKAKTKPENEKTKEDNMFKLPELPTTEQQLDSTMDSSYSSDDEYESSSSSPTKQWDLHTIDEKSEHFRSLPADVRHDILTELKETRKQSSWGRIHELPTESNDFSSFQMKRLLKRHSVQLSLEDAKKEMGGHSLSLGELEALLNEEGIVTSSQTGSRIASNENARYLLIKDVQKAMEKAKQDEEKKTNVEESTDIDITTPSITELSVKNDDLTTDKEFQRDLAAAIQLSLQDQPSTSKNSDINYLENFKDADFNSESESEEEISVSRLKSAQSYMMEYSGLTPSEIAKILNGNVQKSKISKKQTFKPQTEIIPETNESKHNIINNIYEPDLKNVCTSNEENKSISNEGNNSISIEENNSISTEKPNSSTQIENCEIKMLNSSDSNIEMSDNEIEKKNKTKEIIAIESSDSDSDFIEVTSTTDIKSPKTNSALEIVINPNENLKDDFFSDVFIKNKPKEKSEKTNEDMQKDSLKQKEVKNINEDKEITKTSKITEDKETSNVEKVIEPEKPQLTVEELNVMKSNLVTEERQLLTERNTKERMAGNITDQMYLEAQELLELFGVPYIIAPMEAEAQCAFLDEIDLTDGTITDDSDIWLFGGKTVYKNFFNHNKHVLEFRSESIEHHFKLTREQLILLALLVGSDYTLGLQGIGPVTALEILAAFPPSKNTNITVLTQDELISGLSEFRRWLTDGRSIGVGRTVLRNKLRNVNVSEGFPSLQVVRAYLQPKVETCRDRFTWARPDIVGLIDYAKEKFGWTRLKSEEILKPVMKKMDDKNIQKTIKDYFATKHKLDADLPEHKLSKRVKTAINKMGKIDNEPEKEEKKPKVTKKRAPRKNKKSEIDTTFKEPKPKQPAKKEVNENIPQRERDKADALKTKLKAIEVFRKSKQGPGYLRKRQKVIQPLKEDAELSESSDSD